MARLLYFRIVGALALCSFAFLLVSLDPFLSAAPIQPGVSDPTPVVSVNHFRKGDRLPLFHSGVPNSIGTEPDVRQDLRAPDASQTQERIPFACDPAFSPVSAPSMSTVYGRCMA
jgi:hypothetical protein